MTKLDAGLITSLPASDSGSTVVWGSKRINPRLQSCLCVTWSGCPSNDDDDDSLLNSQLSYCILNWCNGNKTLIKRLQQRCNKLVESVLSFNSNSTVCDIMKENKLLTIDQLLTNELIVFMFKQKNGKNSIAFEDIFTKSECKCYTRNKSIFTPKKCSSTVCQQAISSAYWNGISLDLKNKKQRVRSFSFKVYKYLLSNGNDI